MLSCFHFTDFPPLIDSLAADAEETKNRAGKEFSASFRSLLMMHVHVLRVYWILVVRGLQLKRFFTSLFAHARELPAGMVSGLSTFPNNRKRQSKDKGASVRFGRSKFRPNPKSPRASVGGYAAAAERASWYSHQTMGRVHAQR